jgi:hypothetical protein
MANEQMSTNKERAKEELWCLWEAVKADSPDSQMNAAAGAAADDDFERQLAYAIMKKEYSRKLAKYQEALAQFLADYY